MTKKKIYSKILTAALTIAMITAIAVPAAAKETVQVTNNRTVMVEGRSYRVLNKGASKFKTSDSKVAKVTSTGKIIPLKTGYATISMTVKGKKISKKFLFVDKNGTTNSQTKIDKMLAAPNVKTITLKNTASSKTYTIKKGSYTAKTLNIIAPTSKTTVDGDFKSVIVKDSTTAKTTATDTKEENAATGTVSVTGKVDKLTVSSKNVATTVTGTVKDASVTNGNLVVSKDANVANVSLAGTASLQADTTKAIKVNVVKGSDAKITGSATTNVSVVLQDGAKAVIDAAVKVTVADRAKVEVEFTANAADNGATLVLGKDCDAKTTVDKDAKKPIIVTKPDGTAGTVKPGETTENPGNSGGGIGGGGESKNPSVTASYDASKNLTTYNLSYVTFDDLSSYNVTIKNGNVNETFDITNETVGLVKTWSKDLQGAADKWYAQTTDFTKTYDKVEVTIKPTSNPKTKEVTFKKAGSTIDGKKITVTVNDAKSIKITGEGYTCDLTFTTVTDSDNKLKVKGATAIIKNSAGTTYTVKLADEHTSFTITGNTLEKVKINSVK